MTAPGDPGLSLDEFFFGHSQTRVMIIVPKLPLPELPPALAERRLVEHVRIVVMAFGRLPSMS